MIILVQVLFSILVVFGTGVLWFAEVSRGCTKGELIFITTLEVVFVSAALATIWG